MVIIQICVGSSCHLKGSHEIVELLRKEIAQRNLEGDIVLTGSFCFGKCNRTGVTVSFDDNVIVGVTPENFSSVFKEHILSKIHNT